MAVTALTAVGARCWSEGSGATMEMVGDVLESQHCPVALQHTIDDEMCTRRQSEIQERGGCEGEEK